MNIVVIGSSAGAISFVETLRKESDDKITVVTSENIMPYFRPLLSHMILSDEVDPKFYLKQEDFYTNNKIEIMYGETVKEIVPSEKNIVLESNKELSYDKLILAVGSHNFVPPLENININGIFNLKYVADLENINDYAKNVENVTIIGGGLLGIEAAWAFHHAGKKVTIVEFAPKLMARQLSDQAGEIVKEELLKSGIKVMLGKSTKEIIGSDKVEKIILESGEEIPTDILFFSIGVRPNVELAKNAGLNVDRGIVVNENMQTSDENIYAVGDCSQINGMVPGIWPLAMQMGKIAANHLLGKTLEFKINPPIAILKALEIGVYSAGDISKVDDALTVKDGNDLKYFTFEKGILTGVNLIGNTKLSSKIPKMLSQPTPKADVESLIKEI